nr:hypothetical protein [Tanacetum cinerariifolium]
MPSFPSPKPEVSYSNDIDFFKHFEKEFPAIVYNDVITSKSDFLTEPTISPQHIDESNLKEETSFSECDEEEQNVLYFNDLFPFNVIYPNDLKSNKDNDDDKVDVEHSSGDINYGVTYDDEAKRRNSGTKTKTFEENDYLLQYVVSSKEDTAYQRHLITRIHIITNPDSAYPIFTRTSYAQLVEMFCSTQELLADEAFWYHMLNPSTKSFDALPVKIKAPKELPKVSLVNESLKNLKLHHAIFDKVVKIRTTLNARTEGEWGFEHTKAVFNNEIIPFLNSLKEIFNVFDKDLLNEIMEVHIVFDQIDVVVQQSSLDKQCLEFAKKELLLENDRLLQQIMSQNVILTVMNYMSLIGKSMDMERKRNESCDKCFNLDAKLLKLQNAHNDLLKSNYGSKPTGNKSNDRISQTPSRNKKNKVKAQPRKVNKKNRVVEPICAVDVKPSLLNANSICATCKISTLDGVHDMCLLNFVKNANSYAKSAKKEKKKIFGNIRVMCSLK